MEQQLIPYDWLKDKQYHPEPLHNLILLLLEKHNKLTLEQIVERVTKAAIFAFDDMGKSGMLLDWENGQFSFDNRLPVKGVFIRGLYT